MGITVAVKVDHLPIANTIAAPVSEKTRTVLVPNLDYHGTVRATLNAFIRQNLFIPPECQLLSAPLFTRLSEKDSVEDIYTRYACQADLDISELHLDEDTFTMYGRETGRFVELVDEKRVDEYHILDRTTLHLKRLPSPLPVDGGRVFVETKDGILPLLGVCPLTPVTGIKHLLEGLTGIPVSQQLLSTVGRVMHDEFLVRDFDGLNEIHENSIIDLCRSEDRNNDQGHRHMVINVNVMDEEEFTFVVQGRDTVLSVLKLVESRTGMLPWQQKISYSGKVLHEKKTLGSYLVQPGGVLNVTLAKSPAKSSTKVSKTSEGQEATGQSEEASGQKPTARKLKLMRTSKGHVKGTLTIPVLTTDTVSDLKRKLRRTLQPLVERNMGSHASEAEATPRKAAPEPFGDTIIKTPVKTPVRTPPTVQSSNCMDSVDRHRNTSERCPNSEERGTSERRKLSFESKHGGRALSFSKLMNGLSPSTHHHESPQISHPQLKSILHTPQHSHVEAPFSPRGAKSGPLPTRKALDDLSLSTTRPTPSRRLQFDSNGQSSSHIRSSSDMNGSSCRDLMPELMSLPDPDPKGEQVIERVIVMEKPQQQIFADENNSGGRFSNVQSNIDKKLGAIKNIDKVAVKKWFNTNMESLKEHIRVLAADA